MAAMLPELDEDSQRCIIGGTGTTGMNNIYSNGGMTHSGTYTWDEMDAMVSSGTWTGGFVSGHGYVGAAINVAGSGSSGNNSSLDEIIWNQIRNINTGLGIGDALTGGVIQGLSETGNAIGYIDIANQAIKIYINGEFTSYSFASLGVEAIFVGGGLPASGATIAWKIVDYMTKDLQNQGKTYLINMGSTVGKSGNYSFFKFGMGY